MKSILLAVFVLLGSAVALNNGLARTPQMGWNSWNAFHCDINEQKMLTAIKGLVSGPLKKAGYVYVNIDDCWASSRDNNGIIHEDTNAFPHGIAWLAAQAHAQGLLFGVYSDAGYKTCAGRPGSLGYEVEDANTYAKWGVDYLKYDNCNTDGSKPEVRYPVMRDALNGTGRPILFSMCEWGVDNPATWASSVGNSWRTTGDIGDNWDSMLSNADQNNNIWQFAGPGGWNDPDMLEVGNGGMTHTEYITHFSIWCIAKAPLIIGTDLGSLTKDTLEILTNAEAIAVNQDYLGVQGRKVSINGDQEVWAGPLSAGRKAVLLLNRGSSNATITANWKDIGVSPKATCSVRDLWQHKNIGVYQKSYSAEVESHGVAFLNLRCK